jgi:hypothetical protein
VVAETALIDDAPERPRTVKRRRPAHARPPRVSGALLGTSLVVLAAVLRLVGVGSSYDLFEDEVNYVDLGRSLRHGNFPPDFYNHLVGPGSGGGPFLLHPPLSFALSAGWQILTWGGGSYFALVNDFRVLDALLAALSAGLLYMIGARLGRHRWVGVTAALLFALEPYVMRQNGRVFIETPTMLFVLGGLVILLRLYQGRARHPALTAVAGGVVGGLAVVTKDMALLLVLLPLVVNLVFGGGPAKRRWSLVALVSSVVPYGVYIGALAWVHSLGAFWTAETAGLRRFIGEQKSTGFSRKGSPSLTHTLLAQLSTFGTTYLVLILGLLAALYVFILRRRDPDQRLFLMAVLGGGLTVFYALFFGTIEEQFLYFLLVPTLVALPLGAELLLERRRTGQRRWRRAATVAVVAVCVYNLGVWGWVHTHADNGQQRIVAWFQRHDPRPGVIGNDTDVTALALARMGFQATNMPRAAVAASEHIRYLTVLPVETQQSAGDLSLSQEAFFERTGHRVFSFNESTYGDVQIYETDDPQVW